MKFSFDFPEPSVEIAGLRIAFLVFTHENAYGLDAAAMKLVRGSDGLRIECMIPQLVERATHDRTFSRRVPAAKTLERLRKGGRLSRTDVGVAPVPRLRPCTPGQANARLDGGKNAEPDEPQPERRQSSGFPSWAKWGIGIVAGIAGLNFVQDNRVNTFFGNPGCGFGMRPYAGMWNPALSMANGFFPYW